MRPLKLEFSGINSFSEETVIDFEKLTKSGIFGIFGDTGSGKSTILDCISFALFGDVERSKAKTDIINYHCDAAKVSFTFDILHEGKRKVYTVNRVLKKDKRGTHKAALYCKEGEEDICIAEKAQTVEDAIKDIIGVDAEDFRKCIAVPQGEFAQFVKSSPSDRVKLIERLFNLEKYGDNLKNKITEKQIDIDSQYNLICGRLSNYDNVTESAIKDQKKLLRVKKHYFKESKTQLDKATKTLEKVKNLAARHNELDKTREDLKALELEKDKMEELRADLKILPLCRQVRAASAEVEKTSTTAEKLSQDLAECEKQSENAKKQIETLENSLNDGNYDERISKCEKRAAVFETLKGKPEQLKKYEKALSAKRMEYRDAEDKRRKAEGEKIAADNEVIRLEERLKEFSFNLETLINVNLKGTVLRDEYASRLGWFVDFKSKTEIYEENSPLYKLVESEIKGQIDDYKTRLNDVKDLEFGSLNEQIKELQSRNDDREQRIKALEEAKRKATKTENQLNLCDRRLEELKRDGEMLRANSDEIKAELAANFGENCADYAAAIAENAERLKNLKAEYKRLKEDLERAKTSENNAKMSAVRLSAMLKNSQESLSDFQKNLGLLIEQSGLENKETCISLAEKFSSDADEAVLKEYDKKVSVLSVTLSNLEKIEGIEEATGEALNKAYADKNESEKAYNTLYKDVTVAEQQIEDLSKKLEEKKEITKEYNRISAERNIVSQLKEVLKSNKFLEFIANEYLCDISSLASSMLLKLTDGRYFLVYKENNFNVGDNFDCGNLRGVNTLSGGETFLVSLSLALALSQTICSRSLRSIEFFFLDEGFGTLDATLLDTVMNALEKLKSENFTIGVISHVEELKHRIDSKITVIKATETHGSSVQLSL